MYKSFILNKDFVLKFKEIKPNFGFNGLGELTFFRTYSRLKENGMNEQYYETVERVVNTIYSIQKEWILQNKLYWNEEKAQASAEEMYTRIFQFKFTPAGRGFWALVPDLLEKKGGAALLNCAFVSTEDIQKDFSKPFEFLMDMSMLGVGCGFDVKGAKKLVIQKPNYSNYVNVIEDTREGWVQSIKTIINSYFLGDTFPEFDYSQIRPYGALIKTFGGVASGPEPLERLHNAIKETLDPLIGKPITETAIVDIMNHIGVCVVAGNVK